MKDDPQAYAADDTSPALSIQDAVEVVVEARDILGAIHRGEPVAMSRDRAAKLLARYDGGSWTAPGEVVSIPVAMAPREGRRTRGRRYLAGQHLLSVDVLISEILR